MTKNKDGDWPSLNDYIITIRDEQTLDNLKYYSKVLEPLEFFKLLSRAKFNILDKYGDDPTQAIDWFLNLKLSRVQQTFLLLELLPRLPGNTGFGIRLKMSYRSFVLEALSLELNKIIEIGHPEARLKALGKLHDEYMDSYHPTIYFDETDPDFGVSIEDEFYENLGDEIERTKNLINQQQNGVKPVKDKRAGPKKDKGPTNFEDMFVHTDLVQDCIDVLKKVEPPILNENEQFIASGYKGAFCIWVDAMNKKNLIKHCPDRSIYANLISDRFNSPESSFQISESLFGKNLTRAKDKYQSVFETLLSQVSQKVK